MLTEKRYELILELLDKKRSVTVPEIKEVLGVSESTIRRDLNAMAEDGMVTLEHKAGRLTKVFGGAVSSDGTFTGTEPSVAQKMELQQEEKRRIAQFAAGLIQPDDFVYLDAGTTTGYILDYLPARSATFVTNAVSHAKRLAAAGNRVILIGGELKGTTEAVIGSQAILTIQGYHFTKGFFGTNGVSKRHGFTTPDPNEALVKQEAMRQTERCYVLADSQKFGMVSSVTFGGFEEATILTETEPPEGFSGSKNIRVAK